MTDQGLPPTPSVRSNYPDSEQGAVVPQVGHPATAPGSGMQPQPLEPPRRRSRAWIGWTIGITVAILLVVGACTAPFYFLLGADDGGFSAGLGDAVAVIRVDGVIAGSGASFDGYITPEYFYDLLDQAQEDESVKAIVLRVDSPGGTVAASEEIAEYVKTCPKPVVVSVGDIGASGAYMIASQADEIWAMPGSSVGSIGVISEIPNAGKLLDKVGLEFQVITAGKYKDAGSPYRPLTDEERSLIQGSVDEAYGQFIDIVAAGRNLPRSEVESLATGWVWSGAEAKKLKLIDSLGTYQQALDAAAKRGGIDGDYETISYEEDFEDILSTLIGFTSRFGGLDTLTEERNSTMRRALPR